MIFLSSKKTEKAIRENTINSTQRIVGLFLFVSLTIPSIFTNILKPKVLIESNYDSSLLNILIGITFLIVNYFIIRKCYKINKLNDDKDFIERYLLLSIPPILKMLFVSIIMFIIFAITIGLKYPEILKSQKTLALSMYGVLIPLSAIYYALVIESFKRIGENIKNR
jgi:hypothetical protein